MTMTGQQKRLDRALHHAILYDDFAAASALLNQGADVNARTRINGVNGTPLYWAAKEGQGAAAHVLMLLHHGADVNIQTHDGRGPLHFAAERGDLALMQILLDNGADVDLQENDGTAPLHLAVCVEQEVHYAAENGELVQGLATVQVLLDKGADINIKTRQGATPLHVAIDRGQGAMVQLLAKMGADVNSQTNEGASPLHFAVTAENASAALAQMLLDSGTVAALSPGPWTLDPKP